MNSSRLKSTMLSLFLGAFVAVAPCSVWAADETTDSGTDSGSDSGGGGGSSDGSKAIINYLAEVAIRRYEMEMENMFLPAPGSISAMETGILVKNYYFADAAKLLVQDALKRGLPVEQPKDYGGKVQLFRLMKEYFKSAEDDGAADADITKLDNINIATMMQNPVVDGEAVKSLLDILTNPFPTPLNLEALKAGDENYSIKDQQFLAKRAVQQAILSVALNAFSEIAAKRIPSQTRFADEEGTEDITTGDDILGEGLEGEQVGPSMIEVLKSESETRFGNPDWYAEIGRASTEALLREMAHMEAFRLWVEYLKYRQDEVMVSLLATMVAMNAEMAANMSTFSERMTANATRVDDISKELKDLDKLRNSSTTTTP